MAGHHCIRRTLSLNISAICHSQERLLGHKLLLMSASNIPNYLENFLVTPIRMFECEDRVFVHIHMTATNLDTEAMHMFVVDEGRVRKFQGFDNTGLMTEAFIKDH